VRAHQVDPGVVQADRADRALRDLAQIDRERGRFAPCPLRDVVHPIRAAPHHRGDRPPADDEHAIVPRVAPFALDETLQIINAGVVGRRRQRVARAEALQAPALGAEQRFQHQTVAARGLADQRRTRGGVLLRRPGPGSRDPCLAEQHRGHGFVDGALDRAGAVVDGYAPFGERVQDREPKGDLLERPRRDLPHEHAVGERRLESGDDDSVAIRLEVDPAIAERDEPRLGAERSERAREPSAVPTGGGSDDGDARAHRPNDSASRARSRFPPRKLLPEARLQTVTSAGAKSIGSIL